MRQPLRACRCWVAARWAHAAGIGGIDEASDGRADTHEEILGNVIARLEHGGCRADVLTIVCFRAKRRLPDPVQRSISFA